MSKFLRTKDNLYEIESSFVDYRGTRIYQTVKGVLIEETKVVTTGDKIEEVCEAFTIRIKDNEEEPIKDSFDGKHYGYITVDSYKHALDLISRWQIGEKDKFDCFGAIFTDKGLIYKAKLNKESGVLEFYDNN